MRITFAVEQLSIELKEDCQYVIVIEDSKKYTEMIQQIWNQSNGEEGNVIVSSGEKILVFSKSVELIMNPFSISCNDRKILGKVYQELSISGEEVLLDKVQVINGQVVEVLDSVVEMVPYNLTFDLDVSLMDFIKLYNVKFNMQCESVLEYIIEYIRLCHQVNKVSIFVIINAHLFFDKKEFEMLYEFAMYEKIHIISIEKINIGALSGEKVFIIDKDQCIIEIN